MTYCISRDRLVDLLSALDQPAGQTLDHLVSCTECRAEIASLERVREMLGAEDPLPAGFVDHVMHEIDSAVDTATILSPSDEARPQPAPRRRVRPDFRTALVAVLSGVTACVVLVGAWTSAGSSISVTPLSLFVALLGGAALPVCDLARSRDDPSTVNREP